MTQSLPSKHTEPKNGSSVDIAQKDFRNLSTVEMEQLMKEGIKQAKQQMHNRGVSTVASVNGELQQEHPNETKTVGHG